MAYESVQWVKWDKDKNMQNHNYIYIYTLSSGIIMSIHSTQKTFKRIH